ncbi:glycosyltransferase family 2 protein [Helicobacter sp. MIT 99-5507]|uniref:glycosyltransferase family 2 protein n=1 Tax=Helicobacter sp. MIT 99-5507 TaxID=152489 RepID=UPI000E1F8ABE|nr:glycosyltransferase family 2 protein [Helicobacter sp. MIT 99-5507]RDU58622.1 glycosyl transferase [Helicobacter sp. MIT 99-5507]
MQMPKVSVLINLFNYENFIIPCIESVKKQNYQNIEIIVVNDGSSDNSLKIIESIKDIKIINKQNGGQLSAFNAGFEAIDNDTKIVFFLDADDLMNENYIQTCINTYIQNPQIDFMFCQQENIYQNGNIEKITNEYKSGIIGFGLYRAYFLKDYLGTSTSTISIKKEILDKILPLPFENEWRIRADDCIIWGASLVCANIYNLDFYGIKYRIHGQNNHYGKNFDFNYLFKREISIERLFRFLINKNKIYFSTSSLYLEFLSNKEKWKYIKITLYTPFSFFRKLMLIARILKG